MHEQLDEEEAKMLANLHEARERVQVTSVATLDKQMKILTNLDNLKACQIRLADKDSAFDYVTVTDSLKNDVTNHIRKPLPDFLWKSQFVRKDKSEVLSRLLQIILKETDDIGHKTEVKEVNRILLVNQTGTVFGMVVYKEHIYVVNSKALIVHCYTHNGIFVSKYEHANGADTTVEGMCLMTTGDKAMLIVSDHANRSIVWLSINEDFTINEDHQQKVDYEPKGYYANKGTLMVCDYNHMIHQYTSDGGVLDTIRLSEDVHPFCVTSRGDDQYLITDCWNDQVLITDKLGNTTATLKNEIHGIKFGKPYAVIGDFAGRTLIADGSHHQVLLLSRAGDEVSRLLSAQHVTNPFSLYLDTDNQMLYVSGRDKQTNINIFIFDYGLLTGEKLFKSMITKLEVTADL